MIGYGPIFDGKTEWDDPNAKQLGSVLFFNAPDDDFAKHFVETDPYNLHGLYKSLFIARWVKSGFSMLRCCSGVCASIRPQVRSRVEASHNTYLRSRSNIGCLADLEHSAVRNLNFDV